MKRGAIVLCGGRSSRMGRAKAWLPWFGQTMIEHVVGVLRPLVDEIVVVTAEDLELPPIDARVVRDREPDRGPLAGLRDGLLATQSEFAFVTSTDVPHLPTAYVEALFARGRACAPVADGHVQVLSAVYPKEGGRVAEELLSEGRGRPLHLLEALDYEGVDERELGPLDEPKPWQGFNTPEAYLAAVRAHDPSARAEVELLGRSALHADETRHSIPVGTLGEVLGILPDSLGLLDGDRVAKPYLVSLGGRDVVRDLSLPVGPGERVSVIDALAGG